MKQIVFIPLLFICFTVKALTTVLPASPDTTIPKTYLKKAAMLKEFGNNDTCHALIEYWYSKRTLSSAFTVIGGVSALGGGLMLGSLSKDESSSSNSLGGFAVKTGEALTSIFLIMAGITLIAVFSPFLFTKSRKKLLALISDFKKTGTLPGKYLNKIKSDLRQNSK